MIVRRMQEYYSTYNMVSFHRQNQHKILRYSHNNGYHDPKQDDIIIAIHPPIFRPCYSQQSRISGESNSVWMVAYEWLVRRMVRMLLISHLG